jgi:YidC/Oxa1 family membrane protein insertase
MNSQQQRLVLAIVLMLVVLVGGQLLFAPPQPQEGDESAVADSTMLEGAASTGAGAASVPSETAGATGAAAGPTLPTLTPAEPVPSVPPDSAAEEREVVVRGPLAQYTFTTVGARLLSADLTEFPSFTRDGPVELVEAEGLLPLGSRLVVGADTIDLRSVAFEVSPADGIQMGSGGAPQTISFTYRHPTQPFEFEVDYTFDPDAYLIEVRGRARGVDRGLLMTDLGLGPSLNDADEKLERQNLAYVVNQLQEGVRRPMPRSRVSERTVVEGPLLWAATKTTYFVVGALPRVQGGEPAYLGGLLAWPAPESEGRAEVAVTQSLDTGGTFEYRLYAGPWDYTRMRAAGSDFEEVNPVGWRWMRPLLRPIVRAIIAVLQFFHTNLSIGYGWVLILIGVLMRVVLFPLNHKALRAQLKNMAVQPLLQEIQTKYKDQPEKLQKEMMRLHKEHGFNPLAGCWPMLLPWPVLIALYFTFRATIELRGVPFAWLPDLSASDPLYILPVLLGVSMFFMQWISMRTMDQVQPQMKMMMWGMPIFMVVLFMSFPAGLNLYYLTSNVATIPQSWWIARERQKVRQKGPPTVAATTSSSSS